MFIFIIFVIVLIVVGFDPFIRLEQEATIQAVSIENKYILSRHPDTGLESLLVNESALSTFVIWENYNHVQRRADKERRRLEMSGNGLSGDCRPAESIKVYALIFQDGERANETWTEYEKFLIEFITSDRKTRHKYLKNKYPTWYDRWGNFQT